MWAVVNCVISDMFLSQSKLIVGLLSCLQQEDPLSTQRFLWMHWTSLLPTVWHSHLIMVGYCRGAVCPCYLYCVKMITVFVFFSVIMIAGKKTIIFSRTVLKWWILNSKIVWYLFCKCENVWLFFWIRKSNLKLLLRSDTYVVSWTWDDMKII